MHITSGIVKIHICIRYPSSCKNGPQVKKKKKTTFIVFFLTSCLLNNLWSSYSWLYDINLHGWSASLCIEWLDLGLLLLKCSGSLWVFCWCFFFWITLKYVKKRLSDTPATLQRTVTGRGEAGQLSWLFEMCRDVCFVFLLPSHEVTCQLWIKRCTLKFTTIYFTSCKVAK